MRASKLLALLAVACTAALAVPVSALDIALTNDDGWDAPGIQIMRDALMAAGHNVTLAAPLTDQSGGSLALDLGPPLRVTSQGGGQYSVALMAAPTVGAKPGSSALVAIAIAQESGRSPDLLISGINSSANIGMAAPLSGTVGAAAHAVASVLNGPIPAIAVGTDQPICTELNPDCQTTHYQVVAGFVVRFVAHLQAKPGFLAREYGLLPPGVGLIVSYPASDTVRGVRIAVQSEGVLLNGQKVSGGFVCLAPCSTLEPAARAVAVLALDVDSAPEPSNSDLGYFTDGYVTIVPMVPDLTAGNPLVFKSILSGFAP